MTKNKISKNLVSLCLVLFAFAIFLSFPLKSRAEEDHCRSDSYAMDVSFQNLYQNSETLEFKAMPGDVFEADIKNLCATKKMVVNVYVHPSDIDQTHLSGYQKGAPDIVINPNDTYPFNIDIIGGGAPGQYTIRIVGFLLNDTGAREIGPFTDNTPITITSEGIVFSASNPKEATVGDLPTFTIKIFGHNKQKFSLYVDEISGDKRKEEDVPINSDTFTHTFQWNTAGTSAGNHKIIVVLDNGTSDSFQVKINEPAGGGTGGGTGSGGGNVFNITDLNNYNIKNLINSCKAKPDLDGIMCMVEQVIYWLLDIGAVIAFIMILYASIIYLTSYGEESKAELAKKTLIWSVIGVAVIGAAAGIMKIIENILNNPSSL